MRTNNNNRDKNISATTTKRKKKRNTTNTTTKEKARSSSKTKKHVIQENIEEEEYDIEDDTPSSPTSSYPNHNNRKPSNNRRDESFTYSNTDRNYTVPVIITDDWPVRIYRKNQQQSNATTNMSHIQSNGWERLQATNSMNQNVLIKASPQIGSIIFRRIQVRLNLYAPSSSSRTNTPLNNSVNHNNNERTAITATAAPDSLCKTPKKDNTTTSMGESSGSNDHEIQQQQQQQQLCNKNDKINNNNLPRQHNNIHSVVIIRRYNRILIQSYQNKIRILMVLFVTEQHCIDFCDRLIQLNPQQQLLRTSCNNLSSSLLSFPTTSYCSSLMMNTTTTTTPQMKYSTTTTATLPNNSRTKKLHSDNKHDDISYNDEHVQMMNQKIDHHDHQKNVNLNMLSDDNTNNICLSSSDDVERSLNNNEEALSYVSRLLYNDEFSTFVNNLETVLMSTEDGSSMLQALVHNHNANDNVDIAFTTSVSSSN